MTEVPASIPRTQLTAGDLAPGEPLPLDIYDRGGRMLLAKGQIVRSETQLERLLEIGLWGDAELVAALRSEPLPTATGDSSTEWQQVSVFERLAAIRADLRRVLSGEGDLRAGLEDLAARVTGAVALDSDAAIASIQWLRDPPYGIRQSVNTAVLTDLLLLNMEVDEAGRRSAVAAALGMNLCIVDLQETLYRQKEMSADQKAEIARHPRCAAERMRAAGIEDEVWLRAVEEHHEAFDGTGYPGKLSGETIGVPARVISVADKFCATVSERAYRTAVPVSIALRRLLTASGPTMDPQIAARLTREIGIYPPGTLVRLRTGEIGMVVKRTLDPQCPVVRVLRAKNGAPLGTFVKRLTSRDTFGVVEEVGREEGLPDLDVFQLWNPSIERRDDEA